MAGNLDQAILRRIGRFTGDQQAICPNSVALNPSTTTSFGRTPASNVRLLSHKVPLMISRKHASIFFNQEDKNWLIIDHKSLNGVFLNGQKIPSNLPHKISPGDHICFGIAIENNVHEFEYSFETVPCMRKRRLEYGGSLEKEPKVRKILEETDDNFVDSEPGPSSECLKENSNTALCKIQESERKIEGLNLLLKEKEKAYQNQLRQKEKDLADQLLRQKEDLEREKEEQEKYLMGLLQDKLREKEAHLNNQLELQKAILEEEKAKVENELIETMNRKIEEKDKELTTQLKTQRDRLENILQLKVDEQISLQEELRQSKVEREKLQGLQENEKKLEENLQVLREELLEKQVLLAEQEHITKKAEEAAKNVLVEQMEDEFTCIICQELFIEATTLACSHSFCGYCLKSWLRKKKTCPMCRTGILGTYVKSRVLDNAVEKVVATLDEESKTRRKTIVEERKKKELVTVIEDDIPPGPTAAVAGNTENPIVIGGDTPSNNNATFVQSQVPPRAFLPIPRVVLRASVVPFENQAQSGQGNPTRSWHLANPAVNPHRANNNDHCYNCGMRGHWAQACPFRR